MSVIGEFSVPSSSFALDEALTEHPSVVVEAERMATHSTMQVMPFLWSSNCDAGEFRDVLQTDPSLAEVSVSEDNGDGVLYKVIWEQAFRDLVDAMVDHHGAVVEATGNDGTWHPHAPVRRGPLRRRVPGPLPRGGPQLRGRADLPALDAQTAGVQLDARTARRAGRRLQRRLLRRPRQASASDVASELGIRRTPSPLDSGVGRGISSTVHSLIDEDGENGE